MENKEKCIHFDANTCKILRVKACREDCSFYREVNQAEVSFTEWRQRMNGLDAERQSEIAAVYFGGKMLWKEQMK